MIRWTIHAVFGENGCSIYCASKMNLAPCHQLLHGLDFPTGKKDNSPLVPQRWDKWSTDLLMPWKLQSYPTIHIPLFMVGDISMQHTPTINLSTWVDALHNIHVTFVKRLVLSNNIQSIKVPLYIVLYHQVQKKHIETWTISISVGILQPSILSGDSYMYNNTASILIPR